MKDANDWVAQPHPEDVKRIEERHFVRLTDEELIKLGSEHVGPMSDGEFHLMVITQNALEEKNR